MKTWGLLLLIIGVAGAMLSAFAIDTSVATASYGEFSSYLPARVTNLGMQQVQLLTFIASATLSVMGTILLAVSTAVETLQKSGSASEQIEAVAEQESANQRVVAIAVFGVLAAVAIGYAASELHRPTESYNQAGADMALQNATSAMNQAASDAQNAASEVRRSRR